ncbi:site-specific DNA-methyltransferase (adenine-specific) [Rhodoglobus vestalii]|uniref:Methyltransferase n=1 Tax=Rhodoglobus vestalii TaxID=193384 RepID=A0A8H2PVA6_9MICO|nr:site-specific DNA-methyltransferase [Rhodoglobus vestalii]TQO20662.1 site-specific DNA-methyltransferase (adenine-specific) [Rhodoglobus vestalii]
MDSSIAPRIYRQDDNAMIYAGDCLAVLRLLPDNSVDSVVTDPPYGLADLSAGKVGEALTRWVSGEPEFIPADGRGFMGADWDRFVPPPALWSECLRVLKPGGYLVSFAGTRTQDLMGVSIRLAGFRIKDGLQWVRSDVFPKTKQSLKPGYEPILLAQKPPVGTIAQNVELWGTSNLDVEGCRTDFVSDADRAESWGKNQHGKYGTLHGGNAVYGDFPAGGVRKDYAPPGRWPTNIMFDSGAAAELDAANPVSRSRKGKARSGLAGPGQGVTSGGTGYDGEGGPSRFFPRLGDDVEFEDRLRFHYAGRATVKERPVAADGTKHNTVKPLSVMEWLIKLVTPAGGTVLDPFAGSGTTAEAAVKLGFKVIAVEGNEAYLELIDIRLDWVELAAHV